TRGVAAGDRTCRLRPVRRAAGPVPDRRGAVPTRRLGGRPARLSPRPRRPARPFLGTVLSCPLSAEMYRGGGGPRGPERLPQPAPELYLGLPLPQFCQRKTVRGRRCPRRPRQRDGTRLERLRAPCPIPDPWCLPL